MLSNLAGVNRTRNTSETGRFGMSSYSTTIAGQESAHMKSFASGPTAEADIGAGYTLDASGGNWEEVVHAPDLSPTKRNLASDVS